MSFPLLANDALAEWNHPERQLPARNERPGPERLDPASQLVEQFFVEWEVPQAS